ncbi:uncharacterized protein G2W53_019614 [Senna tora]|uniref:Uncharacterized protein n=1 Tax=Senna tora TaxID=362788 RepID=A0A834TTS0_9FABA|nr:uncharacterized protein G2W53_019614 [Senna tora]
MVEGNREGDEMVLKKMSRIAGPCEVTWDSIGYCYLWAVEGRDKMTQRTLLWGPGGKKFYWGRVEGGVRARVVQTGMLVHVRANFVKRTKYDVAAIVVHPAKVGFRNRKGGH